MEFGDQVVDIGFAFGIGQRKMAALLVQIPCATSTDPALCQSVPLRRRMGAGTNPPDAPVISANLPWISLSTDMVTVRWLEAEF